MESSHWWNWMSVQTSKLHCLSAQDHQQQPVFPQRTAAAFKPKRQWSAFFYFPLSCFLWLGLLSSSAISLSPLFSVFPSSLQFRTSSPTLLQKGFVFPCYLSDSSTCCKHTFPCPTGSARCCPSALLFYSSYLTHFREMIPNLWPSRLCPLELWNLFWSKIDIPLNFFKWHVALFEEEG